MKLEWKKWGAQLREIREAYDVGLRDISRETGIDKAAWCRAEQGKPVSVLNYLALCSWMEIHPFRYFR